MVDAQNDNACCYVSMHNRKLQSYCTNSLHDPQNALSYKNSFIVQGRLMAQGALQGCTLTDMFNTVMPLYAYTTFAGDRFGGKALSLFSASASRFSQRRSCSLLSSRNKIAFWSSSSNLRSSLSMYMSSRICFNMTIRIHFR